MVSAIQTWNFERIISKTQLYVNDHAGIGTTMFMINDLTNSES